MKFSTGRVVILFSALLTSLFSYAQSPVAVNGKLKLVGNQLSSECGKPVQLRGMSTHGPQWYGHCVTNNALDVLKNDWGADVFRLAMYVEEGGYLEDPEGNRAWIDQWVDAVGQRGMYCMIDWHIHYDNDPNINIEEAKVFWDYMSKKHAGKDHVIYEICNEPNGEDVTWADIKSYAEEIIPIIRSNDPETIIIVGTPHWSGRPWEVIGNELTGENAYNVMYTYHFYSGQPEHQDRMSKLRDALDDIPVFCTEWGTSNASGNAGFNEEFTHKHLDMFQGNNPAGIKVSWCNWSFSDKGETSAALIPGSCDDGAYNNTSESGTLIKSRMSTPDDFQPCFPQPKIFTHPEDQVAEEGGAATFSVSATGENLTYQWQKDGQDIGGETAPELTVTDVSASDVGSYRVLVSNSYGTLTSKTVQLRLWQDGPYNGIPFPVPGLIEAEEFDIGGEGESYHDANDYNEGDADIRGGEGVDIGASADSAGGYNIGWVAGGEWLTWTVNVQYTGDYDFHFRVATAQDDRSFTVSLNGDEPEPLIPQVNVPNTGGYQSWETVTVSGVHLTEGTHTLRIDFDNDGQNLNYINITGDFVDCNGDVGGTAFIDDCGVCAEGNTGNTANESCTDCNGEVDGSAYTDECGVCAGGSTGIDPGESCGPPSIFLQSGNTTVNEGESITLRVVLNGSGPFTYQWYYEGNPIAEATEATLDLSHISSEEAGTYHVEITNDNGTTQSDDILIDVIDQDPYQGITQLIPGTIEAEDYDEGGQAIGYSDSDEINDGGEYRTDGVDIQVADDASGDYSIGWTAAGEWLEYSVEVEKTSWYDLSYRVSSESGGGEFDLLIFSGDTLETGLVIESTGGWQTFETVEGSRVFMESGSYILRLYFRNENVNFNYLSFTEVPTDCNGEAFGEAYLDDCDNCVGGNTGEDECIFTGAANSIAENVRVYPVPADHKLYIDGLKGAEGRISLLNSTGKKLRSLEISGSSSTEIAVSHLPAGVYYILINTQKGTETRKFIKR